MAARLVLYSGSVMSPDSRRSVRVRSLSFGEGGRGVGSGDTWVVSSFVVATGFVVDAAEPCSISPVTGVNLA